jgi:glycosyltransferase involved in cell wall biosynthesis
MDLSIVIPIYFNEGSITKTVTNLHSLLVEKFNDLSFEFVLVNDGSKDNSWNEMKELKAKFSFIKLINFSRNFGQVSAIYAGYENSSGDYILNVAADLQEPLSLIEEILVTIKTKDSKIVAGKRIGRDESYYRKMTSKFFYVLMRKLSFKNIPEGGFDIVMISKDVINEMLNLNESNPFWQGQILWIGYPVKFIPYSRLKREVGESRWTFSKKIKYLLDGVLSYSYAPLRFFSFIGIITFFLGILYSLIIVYKYFKGSSPFQGWAPLMIVILLFSGLQLVMLGLIGEYVWRNLEQSKNRPRYIIDEKL